MKTKTSMRLIEPHWIFRLLGAKTASLRLTDAGLRVRADSGEEYVILADSLANEATFKEGILFSRLILQTDRGEKTFRGLSKLDGEALFVWLRATWIEQLLPAVSQAEYQIKKILARGYPRTSRITKAKQIATKAMLGVKRVPKQEWCPDSSIYPFTYLSQVVAWSEPDLARLRTEYVEKEAKRYAALFDSIESSALTERQREACIIDEDNNLVLAGAGTGKTSTMVGRAGYLVESGQATENDILMLAFATKAADELGERIRSRLGSKGITASTFHKLGKEIIAAVEGKAPSLSPLADDRKLLNYQVNQWFECHLQQPEYRSLTIEYFQHHLYPEANPFDFDSEGAYFDYIRANDIRTLKGEAVKSLGECLIANYFFKQGIEYQYEARYEYDMSSPLYRQYQPDFFLPGYGIYIEYYGVDRQGNTAPYVDREKYHQGMVWKRQTHESCGTRLVELYHYEMLEGSLFTSIDEQLKKQNVSYNPLPQEAVLETLREFGAINSFAVLLASLLSRFLANCYEHGQLDAAIKRAANQRQVNAALKLLKPIVDDYRRMLIEEEHIDFDDMIGKAITYVQEGRFKSKWRYILVDEFQDISDPRARLVKYLRDSVPECSLFCVGDDWQAVYRFTGSDLSFTTEFSKHFGATQTTALDLTFRFNQRISDVATRFVLENPLQVKKQLRSSRKASGPTVSLLRAAENSEILHGEVSRLAFVLSKIEKIADKGSTVFLLGRYGFNLPNRVEYQYLSNRFKSIKIESYTTHTSKGKEADYVVLLGLEKGKHGFPSEKVTHPLLDALLPPQGAFPFAEERRLFYVALTRARHRCYLITDMMVASDFVVELLDNNYNIELDEFETSLAQQLFHLIKCVKCKAGTVVQKTSRFGNFFGCNNFPLCNYKERGCESCGSQMRHVGRFKVCLNVDCGNWVPTCPKCSAEMVLRDGRNGLFWGCRNYRYEGECCRHTENSIEFDQSLSSLDSGC